MAKFSETVQLVVNGREYTDWESVMVRKAQRDQPPFHCRFTCSEGMPIASNLAKMQIKPGDSCTVYLAGHLAFSGRVETRQVYYDAKRHYVEIQCATHVNLATASVISQTGEWRDKTFAQIAEPLLAKLGIKLVFAGGSPPTYKFPRVSAMHGESIIDFLDDLSRSLGGLSFTSNDNGDFVVQMSPTGGTDELTEGVNILVGREIVYNPSMSSALPTVSQGPGDDRSWGPKVAHMPFGKSQSPGMEFLNQSPPAVVRNEMATSDRNALQGRATTEGAFLENDQITVYATVQGWLRPSGGLWQHTQQVVVTSPMLLLQGETLKMKAIVFTQDDAKGSRTLLEMCNPAAGGKSNPAAR